MKKTVGQSSGALSDTSIPWAGHSPATRAALEIILTRAASGHVQLLLHERVLANICEFRAIMANGTLGKFLQKNALRKLSEARFTLNEIGAMDVASLLTEAISGLQRTSSPRREAMLLLALERELLVIGQHLDRLITQYAVDAHSCTDLTTRRSPERD